MTLVPKNYPKPLEVVPTGRVWTDKTCTSLGVTFSVPVDGTPLA